MLAMCVHSAAEPEEAKKLALTHVHIPTGSRTTLTKQVNRAQLARAATTFADHTIPTSAFDAAFPHFVLKNVCVSQRDGILVPHDTPKEQFVAWRKALQKGGPTIIVRRELPPIFFEGAGQHRNLLVAKGRTFLGNCGRAGGKSTSLTHLMFGIGSLFSAAVHS